MKRILLVVCGTFFVVLGVVGAFLPVLPTTPFLLLAAFCYARGSERFLRWLLGNPLCGSYIRNYREGRGLPLREKILTITALWLTILFSSFYFVSALWLRLLLIAIAAGVTLHLVRIRTFKPEAQVDPTGHLPSPEKLEPDSN